MWTKEKLDEMLCQPSERLITDLAKLDGDIMVLGAGGKMGPSLCVLAANAIKEGELNKKVFAVSRFSNPRIKAEMCARGVECINADLQKAEDIARLPDVKNIVFMVGRKFGTDGSEPLTWGMNAAVPVLVLERYKTASFVVFSSGNVYDLVAPSSGGSIESDKVRPIGEYTQSCLARERIFEYYSKLYGTKVIIFRLCYAIALEYGVICDIARKVADEKPVGLENPSFNCIWQGDANEYALRCLLHASNPPEILNVTGPEINGVRNVALELGKLLGKEVLFDGTPGPVSYLENSTKAMRVFGYPHVSLDTMVKWQAEWIQSGGEFLNKPTHFEETKGSY